MSRPTPLLLAAASLSFALASTTLLSACGKKAAPEAAATASAPDPQAWRVQQPTPGPEGTWTAPIATRFDLSNGIPVYLVENPGLPLVTVDVVMAVGRDANPKGKAGLHALTASMLDEGTKKRKGADLAAAIADLGAELSVWGGGDNSMVVMDALGGEPLAASLDLLTEVLLQPRFDKADFARVKQQTVDQIAANSAEPRDVAQRTFARAIFGADHPFGVPAIGEQGTVSALTLTDAQALYKTWWHAGNATLVVTGATTQAELQPLLEARLGKWAKGKGTRGELAVPATPTATRVIFKEQPGAVQSVIYAGRPAMARTSPDFWPANLAGTLFGGMFGSRLNMNLREEHGWSYGAYGGLSEDRAISLFSARTSVQADKTGPAVGEILKEMQAARREPSAAELTLTRDYLAKSLPGAFETNNTTAAAFAGALSTGLGPDALARYTAELMAFDAAAVGAAATTWLDPAAMTVVVVGPARFAGDDGVEVDVVQSLKDLGHAVEVW